MFRLTTPSTTQFGVGLLDYTLKKHKEKKSSYSTMDLVIMSKIGGAISSPFTSMNFANKEFTINKAVPSHCNEATTRQSEVMQPPEMAATNKGKQQQQPITIDNIDNYNVSTVAKMNKKKKRRRKRKKKKKNKNGGCTEDSCSESRQPRERQLSSCSNDSCFIVFINGGDDCEPWEDDFDSTESLVPTKKVRFASGSNLCEVHPMIKWSFAYQQARIGHWMECAVDRKRFKTRCQDVEEKIRNVLLAEHRAKIYRERFI